MHYLTTMHSFKVNEILQRHFKNDDAGTVAQEIELIIETKIEINQVF